MGLDGVQIIVDTENCFGIEIDNKAASRMRTVEDLVNHVWNNIEHRETTSCLMQILFFRLRKLFVEELKISPSQFKPDTHLAEFGEREKLDILFSRVKSELKLELPTIFTASRFLFFFKTQSDTVQDLIDGIIYNNKKELEKDYGISKDSVFSIIASITHDIVGVPRKYIKPSAKFVDDLGVC